MTVHKAMRDQLLEAVFDAMGEDEDVFFISADFGSPVLDKIRAEYPDRFVNVGIAEQNLINVSTGFALEGCKVFAYAIAPFITMRCYEQIRVNLAILSEIRDLNVNLVGVGAGFSYVVSGPTHQCFEDISIMRTLPNIQVLSPSDWRLTREMVSHCLRFAHPTYLRLDAQPLPCIYDEGTEPDIARGFMVLKEGERVCLMATGYMTQVALRVQQRLEQEECKISVVDMYNLTDFDAGALADVVRRHAVLMTVEEGFDGKGGLDALAYRLVSEKDLPVQVKANGLSSSYRFELLDRASLHEAAGIGEHALAEKIRRFMNVDFKAKNHE